MQMGDIYQEIIRIKSEGGKAALATMISIKGPGPREEGAKLLIRSDGTFMGSMGGESLETEVRKEALKVIKESKPKILSFKLHMEQEIETGFMSGGDTQIFIEPIS